MSILKFTGVIHQIKETQQISDSFKKRELILTTEADTNYPQSILIEFVQDKTDLLNGLKVGQNVNVKINLQGREWTNPQGEVKYFNSLKGWFIEKAEGVAEVVPEAKGVAMTEMPEGDLPF